MFTLRSSSWPESHVRADYPYLRDVFQQSLSDSGGNSPTAFIAILDELDRRSQATDNLVSKNNKVFDNLSNWYVAADTTLKELPTELSSKVSGNLKRVIPDLTQRMEQKATTGARNGAMASQSAIQTLREATERYETKRRKLIAIVALGLPTAFAAAALVGSYSLALLFLPCRQPGNDRVKLSE